MTELTRSTCPYCGVGCGLEVKPLAFPVNSVGLKPGTGIALSGDHQHPANFGRLCSKGSALDQTIAHEDRLLTPQIDGKSVSWNEAIAKVAKRFSETIEQYGPDSVAFYVSGQLLTEDYYVANKLMKGFIGGANIDTNSRLCMASTVAGHRRAFGADVVPASYEDLEDADLIVLVGSNLAWCHPVLFQRIAAVREKRPECKLIVIDPRRTVTADAADLHLPVQADADAVLFNGLLAYLVEHNYIDQQYIDKHTNGFAQAFQATQELTAEGLAELTGLSRAQLNQFFEAWATTEKVVTVFSQGVNQSTLGTDKVNAIINCHLATGRIGKPGAAPFSVTGQPNAMGGREVGGLANMLAAHLDLASEADRSLVRDFWQAPAVATKPGLKAVDLFESMLSGQIRAVWIMATNPADSLPDADRVQAALAKCPFVVVSDLTESTDTARFADVLLPSTGWAEKSGTVTNTERRISRQRRFIRAPGEARSDWWQISKVACEMGFDAGFSYRHEADIFSEHAALSGFRNDGSRAFDISSKAGLTREQYDSIEPFQWPCPVSSSRRVHDDPRRFFANGEFYTPDQRANFIAIGHTLPVRKQDDRPLVMNTGRIRDQWHTMTRTARSARLSAHRAEPFCEIHPLDAGTRGIVDASLVNVRTEYGQVTVRALITDRQQVGAVFVPMHWTDQLSSAARVNTLVPQLTDPVSGQPASKHIAVSVLPSRPAVYGYLLSRSRPKPSDSAYWAIAKVDEGWQMEFSLSTPAVESLDCLRRALPDIDSYDLVTYLDAQTQQWRAAWFDDARLAGVLMLGPEPVNASRAWLKAQLNVEVPNRKLRHRLIAGLAGADQPDPGPTVCACFGVGSNQIVALLDDDPDVDVNGVGRAIKAGSNCGSCKGEISCLLEARRGITDIA